MTSETDRQAGRQTDRPERITLGLVEPRHFGGVHTCTCSQQSDTEPCSALYTSKKLSLGKELQFADILQMHLLTCLSVSWTSIFVCFLSLRWEWYQVSCTWKAETEHLHRQIERNHAAKRTKSWQQSSSLGWALSVDLSGYAHAHTLYVRNVSWEDLGSMNSYTHAYCANTCRKTGYCTSMCSDGVTWWRWRRRDWTHWCINDDGDG